jgi:hypothetical protein
MLEGNFVDDRPPRTVNEMEFLNQKAGEIIDKHKDKNPKHWTINDNNNSISQSSSNIVSVNANTANVAVKSVISGSGFGKQQLGLDGF